MTRNERERRYHAATIVRQRLEAERRITEATLERARTADHLVGVELATARAVENSLRETLERVAAKERA